MLSGPILSGVGIKDISAESGSGVFVERVWCSLGGLIMRHQLATKRSMRENMIAIVTKDKIGV